MDSIKYQQIKNQQVTDSVRNLIMGHVWIFQPDNNPNTNLKNNTKMGHWAQNQASAISPHFKFLFSNERFRFLFFNI